METARRLLPWARSHMCFGGSKHEGSSRRLGTVLLVAVSLLQTRSTRVHMHRRNMRPGPQGSTTRLAAFRRAGTCSGRRSVGCALSWQLLSSLAGVPVLSCASLAMAERPVVLQAAGGVGRRPQHGLADRTGMAPVQSCTAGHHVCLSKQRHTPWACTAALRCVGELSSATHAALLHRQRDEPILVCVCCLRNGPYICCCQLQPGRWLSASAQPG